MPNIASTQIRPSTTAPASDAQMGFLASLALRVLGHEQAANYMAVARKALDEGVFSRAQASQAIDSLKAQPVLAPTTVTLVATSTQVTEVGMYRNAAGDIFKVQRSRTSGGLYAKALTPIGGRRLTEEDEVVGFEFTYAGGAIRTLRASDRMSLEDAKAFGIRYGICCVCGITLKDATSVALGIGPVCGGRV